MKTLFRLTALAGFIILLGCAGSSDAGKLAVTEILKGCFTGLSLMCSGIILSRYSARISYAARVILKEITKAANKRRRVKNQKTSKSTQSFAKPVCQNVSRLKSKAL